MNTPTPTPTPRTNAAVTLTIGADFNSVCPNFARTLEIELNAATAERDQLRAQLHALNLVCGTTDADKFQTWVDRANARAERAEAEVERLRSDRDCEKRLRKDADEFRENAIARAESAEREAFDWKKIARYEAARAERAEADAAAYLKRADSFRKIGDEAEAELATERARLADLVADLNDACITLESAENDCDDYAMQNTAFKLMAVRNVFAAMKEGAK